MMVGSVPRLRWKCDLAHEERWDRVISAKSRGDLKMVLPGVAQPAIQEGKYVANMIRLRVQGRPAPAPFWYWDKGDFAIVGRTHAVADLRFARFAGFPAWLVWAVVHIYFLIGFANRLFCSSGDLISSQNVAKYALFL